MWQSATLAAVVATECTVPSVASTPICAFRPKYHWVPFLVSVTEDAAPAKLEQAEAASPSPSPVAAAGSIHIELRKGVRVSLEGAVDPALVRAVLKSLRS